MNIIKLNGANPQKVADLIGGVLIMHNASDDTATISGGDLTKLKI